MLVAIVFLNVFHKTTYIFNYYSFFQMKQVDDYIGKFPPQVQEYLNEIRNIVKELAPTAEEYMGYGVPAFKLNGKNIVYYAAFKKHFGLYPSPIVIEKLSSELSGQKLSKGTIQFDYDNNFPKSLIQKIISTSINEVAQK